MFENFAGRCPPRLEQTLLWIGRTIEKALCIYCVQIPLDDLSWRSFVFTPLLRFLTSSSAFSSSRAKHFRSSKSATHSFVLFSALFLASSKSLFNISNCLLQDSRWFPAFNSNFFVFRCLPFNLWSSGFNPANLLFEPNPSSSQHLAVLYFSLLTFNFPLELIQLLHTDWSSVHKIGGWSCINGTIYLLLDVTPTREFA